MSSDDRRMLRGFRRRPRRDAHDEIASHLQMTTDELIAAGYEPEAAAAEARRRFGNLPGIEDEMRTLQAQIHRRESLSTWLGTILADLRFAVRTLARRPGFATFAIGTLALGIGGATAIFSVANSMFFKPLPGVRDAATMVEISQGYEDFISVSYPVLRVLSDEVEELEHVAGADILSVAVGNDGEAAVVTMGLQVTDGYFETLGTRAAVGRLLLPSEVWPNDADVAVLSYAFWQRQFDGDPAVLGEDVRLNGSAVTVVGVTEEGFHGHAAALQLDVFVPVGANVPGVHGYDGSAGLESARSGQFDMIGRRAAGVTVAQASAAADAASDRFVQALEGAEATYPIRVYEYGAIPGMARLGVATFLTALLAVVGLVLAITCVNITNLQLSRMAERGREIAVRMSLGAGRARVARQLLIESLVIFAAGAIAGILLVAWLLGLASGATPSIPLPGATVAFDLGIDWRVLAFAMVLTVSAGMLSGLVPGWQAARRDPASALRAGSTDAFGRQRARGLLIAGQVAATVVLLVVAGLFLRSFRASQAVDLGFDTDGVVVASFGTDLAGFDEIQGAQFWQRSLRQVQALPEVEVASLASKLPLSSRSQWSVNAPGVEAPAGAYGFLLSNRRVSADHFRTLGYRIVAGRGFDSTDRADTTPVIVINETMSRQVWPGENPLGKTLDNGRTEYRVVGVVADTVYHDLHEPTPGFGFVLLSQNYDERMILHARLRSADAASVQRVQTALRDLDPLVPMMTFERLDDALRIRFIGDLVGASLSAAFGGLGMLLALFGVYGVTAFWASQRRAEIGIRLALGARGPDVVRWMVFRGLLAPATGLVIGLAVSLGAARLLASLLSGISPLDPLTFIVVAALLSLAGVLATWLPARTAARVHPAETLRTL